MRLFWKIGYLPKLMLNHWSFFPQSWNSPFRGNSSELLMLNFCYLTTWFTFSLFWRFNSKCFTFSPPSPSLTVKSHVHHVRLNGVLLAKIEGPVTGIPSIIIYLLHLGVVSTPSVHQPMVKGHPWKMDHLSVIFLLKTFIQFGESQVFQPAMFDDTRGYIVIVSHSSL